MTTVANRSPYYFSIRSSIQIPERTPKPRLTVRTVHTGEKT